MFAHTLSPLASLSKTPMTGGTPELPTMTLTSDDLLFSKFMSMVSEVLGTRNRSLYTPVYRKVSAPLKYSRGGKSVLAEQNLFLAKSSIAQLTLMREFHQYSFVTGCGLLDEESAKFAD